MKTWAPEVVVAATDGSEGSIRACHVAVNVARAWGSKLLLVTVVRPPEGWWGIGGAPPTATALSNALDNAQQEALDRTIESLDLTVRSYNCLESNHIQTVEKLVRMTEADLLKIRSFGKTSLREIVRKLSDMGLSLGMTDID